MTRATKITDYAALSPLLTAQLRPGVLTNMGMGKDICEKEIQAGTLFAWEFPGGLFLLRQREGFARLNFYLQKGAELPALEFTQPTVLEIAFRERDEALKDSCELWEKAGFRREFSRQRMARRPGESVVPGPATARLAQIEDLTEAQSLLASCFDPLTGCLPTERELREDIGSGCLFVADGGILQVSDSPSGTELRHLAVAPAYRRKGVAQALFCAYMAQWGSKTSRLWVRPDNLPALRFYEKNAYTCDGWTSIVYAAGKDG